MADEPIGETLARRYRVIEILGRGGMGTVYKALDTRLQRIVALKVLRSGFAPDAQSKQRFLREADTLARLNHPNILQVYDVGEAEGLLYLAVEYIEGRSLGQMMVEGKPLDPEYAIEIIRQVGTALGYAHQHGVIHRDVKPSNILISTEGRVLLSDFGLAIAPGAETLSAAGTVAGTPLYMSPEQATGKAVDARSDIFSLGTVLYELLTGTLPFFGNSTLEGFRKLLEEAPVSPRQINPFVPPAIERIVLRSLEKKPDQRFQTADEFLVALAVEPMPRVLLQGPIRIVPRHVSDIAAEVPQLRALGAGPESRPVGRRLLRPAAVLTVLLLAGFIFLLALIGLLLRWHRAFAPVASRGSSTAGRAGWLSQYGLGFLAALGVALVLWLLWRSYAPRFARERTKDKTSPSASRSSLLQLGLEVFRRPDRAKPSGLKQTVGQDAEPDRRSTDAGLMPYTPATEALKHYPSAIAWLLVLDGADRGREFRLADNVTIGRQSDNDIVLLDSRISRRHARISLENERFYVSDLETRHGTFVNGVRVQKHELRDRDEITLGTGNHLLLFIQAVSPADLTVEAKRRLREFDSVWDQLATAARHD